MNSVDLEDFAKKCFLKRDAFDKCTDAETATDWNECNLNYAMYLQEKSTALGADALKVLNHFETCDWHDQRIESISMRGNPRRLKVRLQTHELLFDSIRGFIQAPLAEDVHDFELVAIEIVKHHELFVTHLVSSVVDFFVISESIVSRSVPGKPKVEI